MRIVNIIIVFNQDKSKVLMCLRQKNPYRGLYNFVGGKLEEGETRLESCYRELFEETQIQSDQITLHPLMSTTYFKFDYELYVAYGLVDDSVELVSEKNPLYWIDVNENFEDRGRFAGDGNIQHMMDILKYETFDF